MALELTSAELVKEVTPLIKEYFEHSDSNEVLVSLVSTKYNIGQILLNHFMQCNGYLHQAPTVMALV